MWEVYWSAEKESTRFFSGFCRQRYIVHVLSQSTECLIILEITTSQAVETDSCTRFANIKDCTTGDRLVHADVSDRFKVGNITHSTSANPRKTRKPKQKVVTKDSGQDLDSLILEMSKLDSTCAHPKCKKSLKLVSVKCHHCSRRHCVEHSLPEVHGCGEAAKRSARMSASGKSIRSSTSRNDRAKLQKKLHSKIAKNKGTLS